MHHVVHCTVVDIRHLGGIELGLFGLVKVLLQLEPASKLQQRRLAIRGCRLFLKSDVEAPVSRVDAPNARRRQRQMRNAKAKLAHELRDEVREAVQRLPRRLPLHQLRKTRAAKRRHRALSVQRQRRQRRAARRLRKIGRRPCFERRDRILGSEHAVDDLLRRIHPASTSFARVVEHRRRLLVLGDEGRQDRRQRALEVEEAARKRGRRRLHPPFVA
mmetsp:Transcript_39620/g.86999  ORF Transcript_39620/g.86999 Transcript_39620/m.86999 type:complete len:217 (-) Transcript_39620:357-1007(-)